MSDSMTSQGGDSQNVEKGKGKEPVQDVNMDEAGDDSEESSESEAEEAAAVAEDVEEDSLEEIDASNIVPGGRRTRGVQIDFAKAAEELPEENDEEDDGDFVAPADEDKMEH